MKIKNEEAPRLLRILKKVKIWSLNLPWKQDFPFGHDNGKELKRGTFDDTRRNDALLHEAVVGGYLDTVRMLIGAVHYFFYSELTFTSLQ